MGQDEAENNQEGDVVNTDRKKCLGDPGHTRQWKLRAQSSDAQSPALKAKGHALKRVPFDVLSSRRERDRRAPTPSAAAALVVPDRDALQEELQQAAMTLQAALLRHVRRQLR